MAASDQATLEHLKSQFFNKANLDQLVRLYTTGHADPDETDGEQVSSGSAQDMQNEPIPPGFGTAVPPGFETSVPEYVPEHVAGSFDEEEQDVDDDGNDGTHALKRQRDEDVTRWPGWPGDNVFRLIIPFQKVGAIIGRKGEYVKKICEETRARIKVLDGVPGATERIVSSTLRGTYHGNCFCYR